MNETILNIVYTIAFRESNKIVSIQTYDTLETAKTLFFEVIKNYLSQANADTRIVLCGEPNPDIKYNHTIYPDSSIVLVPQKESGEVEAYSKKKIINQGYIYNSESHRVTHLGTFIILPIKLSASISIQLDIFKDLFAAKERLVKREEKLNAWENDLEIWETTLDQKHNELQKKLLASQVETSKIPTEIESESESEINSPPTLPPFPVEKWHVNPVWGAQKKVVVPSKPNNGFINELELFLSTKWGKIEQEHNEEYDTGYLKYIESVINPGKKKIIFGKVKED